MAARLAGLRDEPPDSHREDLADGVLGDVRKGFQVLLGGGGDYRQT